jgi:hypothetical protein
MYKTTLRTVPLAPIIRYLISTMILQELLHTIKNVLSFPRPSHLIAASMNLPVFFNGNTVPE